MSIATATAINGGGLWLTISDIARQRGVDKAAISRRVTRLESRGMLETRPGARGSKLVNIAAYDRAVGESEDAVRTLNGGGFVAAEAAAQAAQQGDPILSREQARRTAYQADIARLDLEERLKKLLPIDQIAAAVGSCAEMIVRAIDQLPSYADELASAVGKDGAQGARAVLKTVAREIRVTAEREMRLLASGALVGGEPGEDGGQS